MLKECIHHLHANKSEKAITRVSHSMGPTNNIVKNFDLMHHLYRSDFHSAYNSANDRDVIITEIRQKAKVFQVIEGRCHNSFPNFIAIQ